MGEFQGGQPFTVNTSLDRNRDGNLTDRLNSLDGLTVDLGKAHAINLASGTPVVSLIASQGKDGLVGRNSFRTHGIANVDLALWRRFAIAEKATLDLRLEGFNLFNHSQFGIPDRILESPGFGNSFDTQTGPRTTRLAIRFLF